MLNIERRKELEKIEEIKEESNDIKSKEDNISKYEILLNHCQEDCRNQDARKINTDTKTSYMLVFAAFLLGTLLQENIIKTLFCPKLNSGVMYIIIWSECFIIYIGAITLCIISIIFYINVLINRKYEKINTELFKIEDAENETYLDILKGLITN